MARPTAAALRDRALHRPAPGRHRISERRDLRIPMDDGVELLADLVTPLGDVDPRLPTIVVRGPYGRRGGVAGGARTLAREGFTVLFVSCRGTWGSGGTFHPQVDERRDGVATHRWVRAQPWCGTHVATFGASYMGYTQWAVAGHLQATAPELAPDALCLLVTMPDFGAVTWDHGAFALRNVLGWTQMMDRMARGDLLRLGLAMVRPDPALRRGLDTLPLRDGDAVATGRTVGWYREWVTREDLTEPYWAQQSHTATVADVTAPVYMVTGWYDIFLQRQLDTYARLAAAGRPPRLTIGPWGHVSPELATTAVRESAQFLRERFAGAAATRTAPVRAHLTGAGEWHDLDAWPPEGVTTVTRYLHPSGPGAAGDGAASGAARGDVRTGDVRTGGVAATGGDGDPNLPGALLPQPPDAGSTRYVYDPDRPTPAAGGPSLEKDFEPVDNAAHERRPDVLAFRSEVLDAPVTVAGSPLARIGFRSSRPSADVFVRLTDVHPDGRVVTVCDGIRRLGGAGAVPDPEPDDEGFREVVVELWPAFHRFAAGHRIGVQVSSGAHPRYARNPGVAGPAADVATTYRAVQQVSHRAAAPSRIELPVLPG